MAINLARYVVTVHPDFTVFRQELRAEATRTGRTRFDVRPNLDPTAFRAQYRVFEAVYLRDRTFTVTPHLGPGFVGSFTSTFNQIIHNSNSAGQSSGASFGRGFSAKWKLVAAGIVAALPLIQPLVQVLGDVVQAAGAVGAALPAMLAATALGVGTLITAFHNLGKAIKGQFSGDPTKAEREAFEKLSKSAKEFVGILLEMRTGLKGFQTEIQEQFFGPFNKGFRELVSSNLFGILRKEMALTAAEAGRTAGAIAATIGGSARSGQLGAILAGSRESLDHIHGVLPRIVAGFLTLAAAAQPFVEAITVRAVNGINAMLIALERAQASGGLAKFFKEGQTQLFALVDLLGNVGGILKTIFDAFNGGSNTALVGLAALTQKFGEFLKSAQGQQILQLFADKLQMIGDIIRTVLGPVLPIVLQLAGIISGALNGAIRQLLPAVGNLLTAIASGLTPILTAVAPIFDRLVVILADFLVLAIREVTAHINTMMPTLVKLAERLGPQLIPLVEAFGQALIALVPLIPALSGFIVTLIPLLVRLIPLFEFMVTVSTFLWKVIAVVIEWIIKLTTNVNGLIVVFNALKTATIAVVSAIRAAWDAGWAFIRDRVFNPMRTMIMDTIPAAFRRGVDFIAAAWERLRAIAKAPVDFFINTVVNKGIIGTLNFVAKYIPGLPDIKEFHPPGFAGGGQLPGYSDVDNMVAIGPGGRPLALAGGEWIINPRQSRKYGGLLHAINSGIEGFAGGGIVDAILNPAGFVKDRVNLDVPGGGRLVEIAKGLGKRMLTGLIDFLKDKLLGPDGGFLRAIGPGFGTWPSSPGAQRGDSGVWRTIVAIIRGTGPISGTFGNAYRPGDPLWHGSGRAVDWMGFNQDALATFLSLLRPLELIHRTGRRDYAYQRGQNRGSFNNALMEAHRNHVHVAMAEGGLLGRVMDRGGILGPGQAGINLSGGRELMLPEGMKISLSDDTIDRLGQRFAMAMTGAGSALVQMGRAR